MVIALVPLIHFSISFGYVNISSLFALVWSICFPTFVWFCRYISLLVHVSFVSSHFSDFGCRVAICLNPFTGPLLEDVLALCFPNLHPDTGLLQFFELT